MDNTFFVGLQGENVVFLRPIPRSLPTNDALNLAAWIVSISDPTGEEFEKVLEAVQNT